MLSDAITRGRLYQVKFLLESGSVNVNSTDNYGQTPLMKAILLDNKMQHSRYKIVRLLLDHGARINLADKEGKTALMLAVINGHKEITEWILKRSLMDIDLNAGDYDGNTALIHAATRGHDVITRMLIASLNRFGLDIDKKNNRGLTAMLEAVRHGHEQCARVLYIQGSASLTIRDPENFMNAVEWAVQNELFDLVGLFEKMKQETTPSKPQNVCTNSDSTHSDSPEKSSQTSNKVLSDCEYVDSRPESSRSKVGKRSISARKSSNRPVLTVPSVMENLQKHKQQETISIEMENTRSNQGDSDRHLVPPTENEGKGAKSEVSTKSTQLLAKRRSPRPRIGSARSVERCSSAKTEVQRLLSLYGIQNSITYRRGYDPSSLPPSGMWPDPNAVNLSDSPVDSIHCGGDMDYFGSESPFGAGRRSMLSGSNPSRRMSIIGGGQGREGRRMSIISQGNSSGDRRNLAMGRKVSTSSPSQRNNLMEGFGRKPGDRRMSMAPPKFDRPVLRRMNTSVQLSPLVG